MCGPHYFPCARLESWTKKHVSRGNSTRPVKRVRYFGLTRYVHRRRSLPGWERAADPRPCSGDTLPPEPNSRPTATIRTYACISIATPRAIVGPLRPPTCAVYKTTRPRRHCTHESCRATPLSRHHSRASRQLDVPLCRLKLETREVNPV